MEQQVEQLSHQFKNLEEKLQSQINDLQDKLEKVMPNRKEHFYQKHLEKVLKGKHTKTRHGITDIETKDSIIEIKYWKNYKNVVGQLKAYAFDQKTKKRLVAAFYGNVSQSYKKHVVEFINAEEIKVIELQDNADGSVVIKELGTEIANSNSLQSVSLNNEQCVVDFVDQIKTEEKSILIKSDIKTRFAEINPSIRYTNEIAKGIEQQIKDNFGIDWKSSKVFGHPYKGWLGLALK